MLYPALRRKYGLQRTALYALAAQICCLTLCVVSVFCPGSPFDPLFFTRSREEYTTNSDKNTSDFFISFVSSNGDTNRTVSYSNVTLSNSISTMPNSYEVVGEHGHSTASYVSTSLLLAGIIGSRAGKHFSWRVRVSSFAKGLIL